MTEYLYGIQDENGREVCSVTLEVEPGEVHATRVNDVVSIVHLTEVVAQGNHEGDGTLTLHRWPADDKLSEPISAPVA